MRVVVCLDIQKKLKLCISTENDVEWCIEMFDSPCRG